MQRGAILISREDRFAMLLLNHILFEALHKKFVIGVLYFLNRRLLHFHYHTFPDVSQTTVLGVSSSNALVAIFYPSVETAPCRT